MLAQSGVCWKDTLLLVLDQRLGLAGGTGEFGIRDNEDQVRLGQLFGVVHPGTGGRGEETHKRTEGGRMDGGSVTETHAHSGDEQPTVCAGRRRSSREETGINPPT